MSSSAQAPRRVLISGAGVAGPVLAYWLHRASASAGRPIQTTLVERAPNLRTNGQTIDIRGKARRVIADMGLEARIRAACTHEEGQHIVDWRTGAVLGSFGAGADRGVCDIEILRYKMCKILYEATRDSTEYVFGDAIKNIEQDPQLGSGGGGGREAVVEFESGRRASYDVVVLADGMTSRPRSLVFPTSSSSASDANDRDAVVRYRSLGFKTAYFAIPYDPQTDGTWSRVCAFPRSRVIWTRPDANPADGNPPSLRVFLISRSPQAEALFADYRSLDVVEQKRRWRTLFEGAGWQTERILNAMDASTTQTADDGFYMQDIAQIRASTWHADRVVLVGDAAYCPSPMSGMGTSCAITGAYVLANELAKSEVDWSDSASLRAAFASYERICRPYIEEAQDINRFFTHRVTPSSALDLAAFRLAVRAGSWFVNSPTVARISKALSRGGGAGKEAEDDKLLKLPAYHHL
ncbi:hypothetical protein OC844_001908 [Tilletia horrida]|nr:hypothetical protein OC844_001908 [Tilletia horrida]